MSKQQLLRLSKSFSLPKLKQGSKLNLKSYFPISNINILSEWRDDGHMTLTQHIPAEKKQHLQPKIFTQKEQKLQKNTFPLIADVLIHNNDSSNDDNSKSSSSSSPSLGTAASLQEVNIQIRPKILETTKEDFLHPETTIESIYIDNDSVGSIDGICDHAVSINIVVPEKCKISCQLNEGGSINIKKKIEGDFDLYTTDGDILVKKLRGHTINLQTLGRDNTIHASDGLEAQILKVFLNGINNRLRVKRVHAYAVHVTNDFSDSIKDDDGIISSKDDKNEETSYKKQMDAMKMEVQKMRRINNNDQNGDIKLDDDDLGSVVDISSLYVSGNGGAQIEIAVNESNNSRVEEKRAIRIKSQHGPVQIKATKTTYKHYPPNNEIDKNHEKVPIVELNSVNGSCEVSIEQNEEDIQEELSTVESDKTNNSSSSVNGDSGDICCKVHFDSIAPDSVSLITSQMNKNNNRNSIDLTFDRKVEAEIKILSANTNTNEESMMVTETGEMLADYEEEEEEEEKNDDDAENTNESIQDMLQDLDDKLQYQQKSNCSKERIHINTISFVPSPPTPLSSSTYFEPFRNIQYRQGFLENVSQEKFSRFDRKVHGDNTSRNKINTGGKIRLQGAADQALNSFTSSEELEPQSYPKGLVTVASAGGQVFIETLSWIGAIAKRYGLNEDDGKINLGRTATRSGRKFVSREENKE